MILWLVLQTLQTEVSEWQIKADNLKQLSNKLIDEYRQDDTSLIKLQLEKIMNRWSAFLNRSVYQQILSSPEPKGSIVCLSICCDHPLTF